MSRIRLGAAAIAASGVLFVLYPAVRPWQDETTLDGAAASMGSSAWVAAHFFAILGFILMPLGLMALRSVVTSGLALNAAVISWIGAGLTLPYYGAEDFGLHAAAGPAGKGANLLELAEAIRYEPLAVATFAIGLLLLAVGGVLAGVAVWRSGTLPRLSGVLFAAGFALFLPQFYTPAPVRIGHGVLVGVGSVILAVAMWRKAEQE